MADRRMVEAAQWAADSLVGRSAPGNRQVRDAMMAWWAAEDGWDWPTNSRNNPGNLRPAGDDTGSVGVTGAGAFASWHPANFYVYATPGDGVAMMVQRVKRSSHYPGIRSAIARAGTGQGTAVGIVRAVGSSPWGTNTPTMLATLIVARRAGNSPTGTGWATVHPLGVGSGSLPVGQPISSPGGGMPDYLGAFLATIGRARTDVVRGQDIHPALDYFQKAGIIGDGDVAWLGMRKVLDDLAAAGKTWNDLPGGLGNAATAAGNLVPDIAGAIANLPAALGDAAVHVGWLLAILALLIIGLYLTVTAE